MTLDPRVIECYIAKVGVGCVAYDNSMDWALGYCRQVKGDISS